MARNVRHTDVIQLWARAAGMCSHPDCKRRLVLDATGKDDAATVGEAAHIVAHAKRGPRGEFAAGEGGLDGYDNLILLCAHHHAMADRQPRTHRVEDLRTWKAEHEAWVESVTANAPRDVPWTAIVQEEGRRIDVAEAAGAMGPGNRATALLELRSDVARDGWEESAAREWRAAELMVAGTPGERRRFAVFSLGRIPLAAQLGYLLGDRSRAALFHYDRDRGSWAWDGAGAERAAVRWQAREGGAGAGDEAVIRVSLSAEVRAEDGVRGAVEIDIGVEAPSVRWLRAPEQLAELARVYEQALGEVRRRGCGRIHLLYAGPAAGAVCFGRGYNPRMNPPLEVYEYRRGERPCYERALVLNRA